MRIRHVFAAMIPMLVALACSCSSGTSAGGGGGADPCTDGCNKLNGCGLCIACSGSCLSVSECIQGCKQDGEQGRANCILGVSGCDQGGIASCLSGATC